MSNIESLVALASSSPVAFTVVVLTFVLYGWIFFLTYRTIREIQYTKLARKYLDDELIGREEELDES